MDVAVSETGAPGAGAGGRYAPPRPHVTPEQEDLLRVIYLPDEAALPLFRRWYGAVDMQDLDDGCYRLYPQLFKKLRRIAPDNAFLGRLRGNYRKAIYHNRLLFHRTANYVGRLRRAGIDCIILKGAALLHEIKHDAGGRPMADVDILIRKERLGEALRLHSPVAARYAEDPVFMATYPELRGEITLFLPDRLELDLHWHVSPSCRFMADADEPFWERSREIEFEGVSARVLSTTDLLYHICVHGVEWNPVPTIRWIADSLDLLAACGSEIDWERLIAHGARYRTSAALLTTFNYLRHEFAAPIPAGVLERLAGQVGAFEREELRFLLLPWSEPVGWAEARPFCERFLGLCRERWPQAPIVLVADSGQDLAAALDWCAANRVEFFTLFPGGSEIFDKVRQHVRASPAAAADAASLTIAVPTAGLGLDPRLDGLLYATIHGERSDRRLRVYATDVVGYDRGRVALRANTAHGLQRPMTEAMGRLGRTEMLPLPEDYFRLVAARGVRRLAGMHS